MCNFKKANVLIALHSFIGCVFTINVCVTCNFKKVVHAI